MPRGEYDQLEHGPHQLHPAGSCQDHCTGTLGALTIGPVSRFAAADGLPVPSTHRLRRLPLGREPRTACPTPLLRVITDQRRRGKQLLGARQYRVDPNGKPAAPPRSRARWMLKPSRQLRRCSAPAQATRSFVTTWPPAPFATPRARLPIQPVRRSLNRGASTPAQWRVQPGGPWRRPDECRPRCA